jgi:phosphohistidine phosphatase
MTFRQYFRNELHDNSCAFDNWVAFHDIAIRNDDSLVINFTLPAAKASPRSPGAGVHNGAAKRKITSLQRGTHMKTMRMFLIQHGEATTEQENPERPLTEPGRAHVVMTAAFLQHAGVMVDAIWHSGKARSRESAELLARHIHPKEGFTQKNGLAPKDPAAPVLEEILLREGDLMIVGHLPFLQKLASLALTGEEDHELLEFSMGGAVCLGRDEKGKWRIVFKVNPDLLERHI